MYRTQLSLDRLHPSVRQGLRDCNDMHRTLMRAFPQNSRAEAQLLYRVMTENKDILLYMQSDELPDISRLTPYGVSLHADSIPREISVLKDRFVPGLKLRFNLLAYPSKKVAGEGTNSRRVFLKDAAQRVEWLTRKAGQCGFLVDTVDERSQVSIRGSKNANPLKYVAVEFDGILTIQNTEAFWQGYCGGLGAGKAYGLGLLMLKLV